jgi:UDP-2,3-diacylglucosamine pyrophosphatase LpxH
MRWALLHDTLFALRTFFFMTFSILRMISLSRKHPLLDFKLSWAQLKGITIYPSFVKEARKILRQNPRLHAVIFGHTHVLRYRQWGGGKEYFNTGTWNEVTSLDIADFGLQTLLTYGFIELPSVAGQRPRIRLKEWKGMWRPEVDTSIMPVGK